MKHTVNKPVKFTIMCSGELVELQLQPLTFRRLIDIKAALGNVELVDALRDPTPLQLATIAYCMLLKSDIEKINNFRLEINEEKINVNTIHKLYYIVTENNIQDGYTNYTSMVQAVNKNIIDSFPETNENKKKAPTSIKLNTSLLKLKRFLTL